MITARADKGTPVFEVEITETRPVTVTRKFTILGGDADAAVAKAEMRLKRQWERLEDENSGHFSRFAVGPKIVDATAA